MNTDPKPNRDDKSRRNNKKGFKGNTKYTAAEIKKLNDILGDIDTEEGLAGGVEDISNEEMEEVQEILFGDDEDSKNMERKK